MHRVIAPQHASKITDIARYRAARQHPVILACRWSIALQAACEANVRALFTVQRAWLRAITGI